MNSLKTVLIVVVLAAFAGAVYVMVNNKPSETAPPPEVADGWSTSPNVEMPDFGTTQSPFGSTPPGASADSSTTGGLAPPFSPDQPAERAMAGGMAPPFPSTDDAGGLASRPSLPGPVYETPHPAYESQAPDPASADGRSGEIREAFTRFMQAAHEDLAQGRLAEVHQTLSLWYDNPQLTPEENRQLTELLDQVAGSVVYSCEHVLERPYTVQAGDTLPRIARAYGVPWQLLAKINGILAPENLEPGRQLKVVRGPFDAVINLEKHEMTLMLGGLYAGRFPIGVGRDQESLEGTYFVEDKIAQFEDPNNPLGQYWIKLNDRIGIHGTNDPRNIGADGGPGTISLNNQDIEDVHDILSVGSRVQILR